MVSYTGTYGSIVGLMALAVIAACVLLATRLTSFAASWKSWYTAFAIITTITTLLGLTYESMALAVTADEDSGYYHGSSYNQQLMNAYTFVNLVYGLFLNVSQVLLFATTMEAGVSAANSSSRKLSQLVTYLVSGLLVATACVKFALECNYNAWFIVRRYDDRYDYYDGPPSDLEKQALVSTQLDFAFSSIMLVAAVVAIGQSVVASNKAHANKTSTGRLVLAAVLLLITTATQLGILASLVDPSTGMAKFYERSVGSYIAVAILAVLLVVWPLVASMATLTSAGKQNGDFGGSQKVRYSQESTDGGRFGNAPRETVVV